MAEAASSGHQPVLLGPVLAFLAESRSGTYLDATFGGGGHTRALLEGDSGNRVVALDCDPEALLRGRQLQESFPGRLTLHHLNFGRLASLEEEGFCGILFDFGVSSFHFDQAERGFSFQQDGPLDMRMDPGSGLPASAYLNQASHYELVQAVRDFGEETRWRRVVAAIEQSRGLPALERTRAFAGLIEAAVGGRRPGDRIHPATRTFQGVRIAVNRELEAIEEALPAAFEKLEAGGRLAVISFHSLEDRRVKRFFRRMAGQPEHRGDATPAQFRVSRARILTNRPVLPEAGEVAGNPRARSARLRVLEKERRAA